MDNPPAPGLGINDLIGDKRDQILELAAQFGASNVRVFGSVARGEARPDSDVDLLITFPGERSIFELVGLWLEMQDLLGRDVSLISDQIDDQKFLKNAQEDAIPL